MFCTVMISRYCRVGRFPELGLGLRRLPPSPGPQYAWEMRRPSPTPPGVAAVVGACPEAGTAASVPPPDMGCALTDGMANSGPEPPERDCCTAGILGRAGLGRATWQG